MLRRDILLAGLAAWLIGWTLASGSAPAGFCVSVMP